MVDSVKPKKPTIAVIDLDYLIFSVASSPVGEQVFYTYHDPDTDEEIARFSGAKAGKQWIEEVDIFGMDAQFGYEGDHSKLIRKKTYEVKELNTARKHLNKGIRDWLKLAGVEDWVGRCSSSKGAPSFRNEIATICEYKGNRVDARTPHWLDSVRKYAIAKDNVKKATGGFETDDVVCSLAQKGKESTVLVACDKDARGVSGCWFLVPGDMTEPYYSDPNIVGEIYVDKKSKLSGCGWLFWLGQSLVGDTADNYKGCKGVGPAKAVEVLGEFHKKPISMLPDAARAACRLFKDKYGETHTYNHWNTGEEITASYKDLFIENIVLAYMVKNKKDKPTVIIDAVKDM